MIEKHLLLFWEFENTDSIKIETKDSDTGSIMIHFENHTEEWTTSINGFVSDSELEDLRIYRWLKDRTPPKGFFKVLSFNLYKRDIKNLKSYLPKELKKNNVLNLVYFLNDSDFKNKSSMIVFDEMNWIFSARGHVLFKDDSILSLGETVIQKGLNLKVHKKKHFPIISEFSPDLFLDIQEDNYECTFYTDKKNEDDNFGKWYLKLDNQDGITYHFFSDKQKSEGDEKFFQLLKKPNKKSEIKHEKT